MSQKKSKETANQRWLTLVSQFQLNFPHIASYLFEEEEFRELRIKVMSDGVRLAIAKRFGSDGGPEVCFGSGYDPMLALMALDAAIQGGNWRFDKPWQGKDK